MTGSVGVKEERARAAHHGQQTELIPSRFLTQQLHRLPKGRVLDVASGRKLDSSPINRGWNYLPTIQWMQGMKTELDPRLHEWTRHERVILFDGVCNWCNAWVNFAIDRDPRGKFKLGTLQSEQAQQILKELQLSTEDFETFLLLEQTRIFTKSTAALRIARHLSGLWPLLYLFIVIPRPIRDAVYNYIARHRYKWMGKAETCRIPTPSERARFL
jgi:predicted DCC family thiol-disulfide oxidoreductase YuxK/plasmid stability protein